MGPRRFDSSNVGPWPQKFYLEGREHQKFCLESRELRAEGREQRPESRNQRPETRDQRAESKESREQSREQRSESREQISESEIPADLGRSVSVCQATRMSQMNCVAGNKALYLESCLFCHRV